MDWKTLAAKLAAMGLPVLGKAIGTLVGGQIPIFGNMIEGAGENIGAAAAKMIAEVLGVEPTAEAINTAIETKPTTEVFSKLQAVEGDAAAKWAALPLLAREDTEAFKAGLADNQDARKQMLALVEKEAPAAWGPVVVSGMVVFSFTVTLLVWLVFPPSNDPLTMTVLNVLVGTLAAAFTQVVSYWLGSSAGSANKDSAMKTALAGAQINTQQAIAAPAKAAAAGKVK
jgi:hypothetical protein